MQPDELKQIQTRRGWSNYDLADLLGVSYATVVKWRGGQHPIPRPAVIAVRALDTLHAYGIPARRINDDGEVIK